MLPSFKGMHQCFCTHDTFSRASNLTIGHLVLFLAMLHHSERVHVGFKLVQLGRNCLHSIFGGDILEGPGRGSLCQEALEYW